MLQQGPDPLGWIVEFEVERIWTRGGHPQGQVSHQFATSQDQRPIAQQFDLGQQVGRDQHRDLPGQASQQLPGFDHLQRIEADGGLIEQQHPRIPQQGIGQAHPPAISQREAIHPLLTHRLQLPLVDLPLDSCGLLASGNLLERRPKPQVLGDREDRIGRGGLGEITQLAADRRGGLPQVMTIHPDFTRRGGQQRRRNPEQRALTRPIGSQQADQLSRRDLARDIAEGGHCPITTRHVLQSQGHVGASAGEVQSGVGGDGVDSGQQVDDDGPGLISVGLPALGLLLPLFVPLAVLIKFARVASFKGVGPLRPLQPLAGPAVPLGLQLRLRRGKFLAQPSSLLFSRRRQWSIDRRIVGLKRDIARPGMLHNHDLCGLAHELSRGWLCWNSTVGCDRVHRNRQRRPHWVLRQGRLRRQVRFRLANLFGGGQLCAGTLDGRVEFEQLLPAVIEFLHHQGQFAPLLIERGLLLLPGLLPGLPVAMPGLFRLARGG